MADLLYGAVCIAFFSLMIAFVFRYERGRGAEWHGRASPPEPRGGQAPGAAGQA